jgi:glycine/D-amino acid oxidase-like deaminating enzyme
MVSPQIADLLVIGDGLIGLSTALEAAAAGASVVVVGSPVAGAASTAAAGLLIPVLERLPAPARAFYADSLDRYPAFLQSLAEFDPALTLLTGLVERGTSGDTTRERDAAIDNVRLVAALRAAVNASPRVTTQATLVDEIDLRGGNVAHIRGGARVAAHRVVLAAGAWSTRIRGLPRALPVRPLKGQMIALDRAPLQRAMMGDDVYLVPRDHETLVGATVEEAGFDLTITAEAVDTLRRSAVALCPDLDGAKVTRSWSGLRPATPDMLPILGADPDHPSLVYATGHSKNGVLLTPATAVSIAALCLDRHPPTSIDAFSIARFS